MYNAAATTHFVLSFQRRMKSIALPSISNLTAGARTLYAAGFYFVCSISMNFLNKLIISSYGFNFPAFIMVCQVSFSKVLDPTLCSRESSFTDGRDSVGAGPTPPLWPPLHNALHTALWHELLAGIPVFWTSLHPQATIRSFLTSSVPDKNALC